MANHVHVADIDTELQGSRCHHHGVCPGLELLFDFQPRLTREAAMMRSNLALAQPLAQLVRHALDQTARIDEYQCRPVRLDLLDELIEYGRPNILANNRAELLIRYFDAQIHLAPVANVDNRTVRRPVRANVLRSNKQPPDLLDGFLRGAQADALQRSASQSIEALERKREMGAALVLRDGVNFVDDQCLGGF